jgi:L-ascorbate metabolism protein UlaG (beta-lactamase superfamily)
MHITFLGSATVLIEIAGLRLLTDPVFDAPGKKWVIGHSPLSGELSYTALQAPALAAEAVGPLDAVLLSHDQHKDNLDRAGLELARGSGTVLTTTLAARRLARQGLSNLCGLAPGDSRMLPTREGPLCVTATPARHGPWGLGPIVGPVVGFLLEHAALPGGRLWITGDTRWFAGLRALKPRVRGGLVLPHLGAGRFGHGALRRWLRVSMDAGDALTLARELEPRRLLPIHFEGWSHFSEGAATVAAAFAAAGIEEQIQWLERGVRTLVS